MSECYKIPMTVLITSGPHNIIGATLFIAETMNVALTGIHGLDTVDLGVRQARLDAEASSLAKMYIQLLQLPLSLSVSRISR